MNRRLSVCLALLLGLFLLPGCPEGETECYRHEECGPCGRCQNGSCIQFGDGCDGGIDDGDGGQADDGDDGPLDAGADQADGADEITDPCAGVDCSTAPSACYGEPGECVEGICRFPVLAVCGEDDSCCPPGCGPNSDVDCPSCDAGQYPCIEGCCPWTIEVVDDRGDVGLNVSVKLDQGDSPHFSYQEGGSSAELRYARRGGGGYIVDPVYTSGSPGGYTSLALDGLGHPHIGFSDWFEGDEYYAYWDGMTWTTHMVETDGHFGNFTSLALDGEEQAHLTYFDDNTYNLRYAVFNGQDFDIQVVDDGGDAGRFSCMVLDNQDRPHISYYVGVNRYIKYAWHDGQTWEFKDVDDLGMSENTIYGYTSIALDAGGNAHIAYYDWPNGGLKYARWTGSDWSMRTVDDQVNVGAHASLALTDQDHPHIAYYDVVEEDLKYAFFTSIAWEVLIVEAEGSVGQYVSLDLDANNHPHFGYYNDSGISDGALHYARH